MDDNKRKVRLKALSIVVFTLLTVLVTYAAFHSSLGKRNYSDFQWTLNGDKTITLPYYSTKDPSRDYVVLTGVIPKNCSQDSFIGFFNRNGKYEILFDSQTIYTGGYTVNEKGEEIPITSWNKFPIDEEMAGREISFRIYLDPKADHYSIDPISMGDDTEIILELISRDSLVILADAVLAVSAIMMLIIAISSKSYIEDTSSYVFFSIFVLLFAMWIMTDRSLTYFFISGEILTPVSYLSLALVPIPFVLFVRGDAKGVWRVCFDTATVIGAFITVFLVAIYFFRKLSFINTITVVHVYILALLLYTLVYKLSKLAKSDGSEYYPRGLGIAVFTAFCLISLFETNFYGTRSTLNASAPVLVGFLVYSACIFIDLMHNLRATLTQIGTQRLTIEETKTQLVLSQIKPHFIYNSLGAIRVLIKKDPDKAYDALYKFTKYLRQNIDVLENSAPIPFKTELEHIDTYVEIEKLRFSNKIEIEYDTEYVNFSVPPLSIQIFVENAIKHGVFQKSEGTVRVSSRLVGDEVHIVVEDNGVGFDTSALNNGDERKSVGMKNSIYRIEKTMGGRCEIESTPGVGTTVTVKIPLKDTREE